MPTQAKIVVRPARGGRSRPKAAREVPAAKMQLILRHAAQIFSEKGYEGASIRDLSRSSGVSLAGLYYYIESKQKLLYLIQQYTFQTIVDRLEKRLEDVRRPEERLRAFVHNHLDYFLKHRVEMKVLSHEDDALEGQYRREVMEIKRRYYGIALGIVEGLKKSGAARRVHPRVAVLSLFGMMNWVYTWHRPEMDPQADVLAEEMAGMFLRGVLSREGLPAAKPHPLVRSGGRMAAREIG
jgi:TetR/AcrR family transcriptional regulator, cholesterol catabolism regulator